MSSQLSLTWTIWSVVLGVLTLALTAVLGVLAWRRSGYALRIGLLELLRLTIVLLVVVTLNQPEWLRSYRPQERPTLVVLEDQSRSMQTCDVVTDVVSGQPLQTRAARAGQLSDRVAWKRLAERLDVVVEPFSSQLDSPEEGTDIHAALTAAAEQHDNLRAVVLVSDGDWNAGEAPVRAASQLRIRNVPVYCIAVGSDTQLPDVELVRVDAPTFGVAGKPLRIPFVIDSSLPRDREVTVSLVPSTGEEVTTKVVLPAMSRLEDTILWHPAATGEYQLTVHVPVDAQEVLAENNQREVPITVRDEAIKVLLVESVPRWEYRYLRNALERDPGVDVSCLLFHPGLTSVGGGRGYIKSFPTTMEELSRYDVVFLGDVGLGEGQLTTEQCRLLKGLVQRQASGLILMPGLQGRQLSLLDSELEELYPVTLDPAQSHGWGTRVPAQFELTSAGRQSLLTRLEDSEDDNAALWEGLPGFQWYAAVERAKVNSEILATHRTERNQYGRIPLLVTRTYGTGKVLFMGTDGVWRWREGVEDKYHYRFWGQVARWMAYQRSMAAGKLMRLYFSPDRPQVSNAVTFYANVAGSGGEPLAQGVVTLRIEAPSGQRDSVRLLPRGDEWGLFSNTYIPKERGSYQLTLTCQENGSTLDARLDVQGTVIEKVGKPTRSEVLQEIADVTGGKLVAASEMPSLLETIGALPEPAPDVRRVRLWCHPTWMGLLVFLLALFWTGRKMVGTV